MGQVYHYPMGGNLVEPSSDSPAGTFSSFTPLSWSSTPFLPPFAVVTMGTMEIH